MHESNPPIKLVIGLGNPGPEYKNTYHNAGFLFIDYLKENAAPPYSLPATRYFLKSDVFMNESGAYVKKALKKYGAKPENLLVAHDDSDIHVGDYKLSFDRGAAGHKGVASIINALGTKKFWRLRIGVRASSVKGQGSRVRAKAGEFVLWHISKDDQEKLLSAFEKIVGTFPR